MNLIFVSLTVLASLLGGSVTRSSKPWYRLLRKPKQTPPDWVFGAVWPVLYGLIAWSGSRAWKQRDAKGVALWGTQLALNAAWSPLFFGARKPRAAMIDLGATLATATMYTARMAKLDKVAAAAMVPYLGWLSYAATLNAGIIKHNPRLLAG